MTIKTANRCNRLRLAPATTAALLASTALVSAQTALPTGGQVAAGSVTISASGPAMTVTQGSQRAIVNWQGFSVGQPNSVHFAQPSASSAILNRVTGSASSTIAGQITGNGQVFLVNPNGIAITATGTVKVGGGFVASTLGIEDRDFMAGRLQFNGGSAPAAVSNDGAITAGSGGFVGLLGGVVSNGGTISVPLGRVGLGAAAQATLDPTGDGFLQVAVPSGTTTADGKALIDVSGKVSAYGGRVEIKAATAQAAVRDAINVSGKVSASSISGRNGSVVLGGGDGGTVRIAGRVSASGRDGAGRVAISGRVVEVAKGASVKARSEQGQGGSLALKGDIVNNSGTVDASGASGGAIDVAGISIGSYGVWNLQGASGAGGAFTARGAQSYVETTSGMVLASGATGGGSIAIDAPNLFSSGRQDASSSAGRGGKVTLTGQRLALVAASIDASGATGGGAVRIGGDYQGGGTLAHAATTTISPATTIRADATQAGNGGSVVVWSSAKTDFYGAISARGGQAGGNGGLVEVSSKGDLVFGGSAAVNAPLGTSGTVLLDPKNIVIDDATGKYPQYQLIDPLQGAGNNQFGSNVAQLQGVGKTVVTAHGTAIGGQNGAGAVYLYDTVTGALISTLTGTSANNFVGNGGITTLSNGNYVIRSANWTGNTGAVTWGSGATGVSGAVSSSNSLVGSTAGDNVGIQPVIALSNGNYVVRTPTWGGNKGAVTWGNGATGATVGVVSSSNSLIASTNGSSLGFRTAGDTNDVFIASSANDSTSGRVYVGLGDLNALTFDRVMAQDVTIRSDAITRQLNAGSALTLQASNDITVNSAITANNPAGNGGHLTLQAGRSILVNAAITTDNGNLTLIGNDRLANGVVDAQRDAGAAVITLGAAVDAGTGTVDVQLRDGAGKTNTAAGAITLGTVTAGKVSAVNSSASGGLTLDGTVTASGTGDAVVLASNGAFTNNAGAGALSLTGGGRWLVYSDAPATASFGNLDSGQRAIWNASYATLAPGSVAQTGNRYLFAYRPTLTYTSTDLAKTYGDDAAASLASAYTVSGLNAGVANAYLGDTLGSVVSGSASVISTGASAAAGVAGSSYAITVAQGSLSASTGYALAFNSAGLLTVTPRAVTVTASSGQGKVYGNVDPTLTYAVTAGSLVGADTLSGSLGRAAGENVGNYAINRGTLANPNYAVSFVGSNFGITPRAVTVSATAGQSKVYGNVDPALAYTVTAGSLLGGDSLSGSLGRAAGENVGNYAINQGTLANPNYAVSFVGSNFGITPRAVTVSATAGQSKTYGDADPTLAYTVTAGSLAFADSFSGSLSRAAGENVGNYAINQGSLALNANYTLSYAGSNFGITPRAVTVSATAGQGKVYGNADAALAYTVTAGNLVGADAFSGALSRAAGENVGNYAINQGSLALNANYTLSYAGSNFGITP
ncbi:beta strand repeat-containing protein [Bosea beijingensis]